jgi:fumarylacetoacetase
MQINNKQSRGITVKPELNETHDPALRSWVASANAADQDFPIQNLPFAVFRRAGSQEGFRGGVAIGDQVLDLGVLSQTGLLSGQAQAGVQACSRPALNDFMAMGREVWSALRLALSRLLRDDATGNDSRQTVEACRLPQDLCEFDLPCRIGDYTDFYTSIYHATAIGKIFRPDNPLLPNYKWVPIGYHGRASSIGISGQRFPRPKGQIKAPDADQPEFAPCKRLDYELEMGILIGPGNQLGESISIESAEDHVFGLCLLNDWSARDIQAWEYQPLGPFLAKSFASTVSPWIVTMEALQPYRSAYARPAEDPQPLPYLSSGGNSHAGGLDIELEVLLQTEKSRKGNLAPVKLSQSNFKYSYWTVAQMVAHHSVNGCNLRPGDLFGSGTQSGPERHQAGSLLELTQAGNTPIELPSGERRVFLEDGDTVILRGWCEKPGIARIGFGSASGTVIPPGE